MSSNRVASRIENYATELTFVALFVAILALITAVRGLEYRLFLVEKDLIGVNSCIDMSEFLSELEE